MATHITFRLPWHANGYNGCNGCVWYNQAAKKLGGGKMITYKKASVMAAHYYANNTIVSFRDKAGVWITSSCSGCLYYHNKIQLGKLYKKCYNM